MRVLFVCTGNTCRSPMAERLARRRYPDHHFESAGVLPARGMHPLTGQVLAEHQADNGGFTSRSVYDLDLTRFDVMVLIGSTAQDLAPDAPPTLLVQRWEIDDPYEVEGSPETCLTAYRACAQDLLDQFQQALVPLFADGGLRKL